MNKEGSAASIVPPGSTVAGQTIGEWTGDWWEWAAGQSVPNDAFTDTTGANADVNQSGPVWFVAGTFGGPIPPPGRSFQVPSDRYLLFPMVNVASAAAEPQFGFDPDDFDDPATLAAVRADATGLADMIDSLLFEIDGVPATDLFRHREVSGFFSMEFAPDNPIGVDPGPSGPAFADGYWVMLEPLPTGTTITTRYGGGASAFEFSTEVTATISSVPEPAAAALLGVGLVALGVMRRRIASASPKWASREP